MEELRLELPGRRLMVIRPMESSDAPAMEQLYTRLSEDDLYKRFFSSRPPPAAFVEKMAGIGEAGGFGVVAVLTRPPEPGRLVAEATFAPLADGTAEVGITVEPSCRGWLGPYLLDLLVEEAHRRGIANLQAEVLATNRQMQALLEARGSAVIEHSDRPAIVRLIIGTAARSPAWSADHDRPRLLVEAAGGRWRGMEAARRAGFEVLACPGIRRKLVRCPALAGRPCPLAAAADVIVDAIRDGAGGSLMEAHHRLHPGVPVCVDVGGRRPEGADGAAGVADVAVPVIDADLDDAAVVELLEQLAGARPEAVAGRLGSTPSR